MTKTTPHKFAAEVAAYQAAKHCYDNSRLGSRKHLDAEAMIQRIVDRAVAGGYIDQFVAAI